MQALEDSVTVHMYFILWNFFFQLAVKACIQLTQDSKQVYFCLFYNFVAFFTFSDLQVNMKRLISVGGEPTFYQPPLPLYSSSAGLHWLFSVLFMTLLAICCRKKQPCINLHTLLHYSLGCSHPLPIQFYTGNGILQSAFNIQSFSVGYLLSRVSLSGIYYLEFLCRVSNF